MTWPVVRLILTAGSLTLVPLLVMWLILEVRSCHRRRRP